MADKPRIDFYLGHLASLMPRDAEYWMGIAVYLPADYEEETVSSREQIIQLHSNAATPANNHGQLDIIGSATGASFTMQCNANSDSAAFSLAQPILARHKGAWTFHVFNWRIDWNGTGGKMWYWLTQDGYSALTKSEVGTAWGSQNDTQIQPSVHNFYKGSWRNDGSYTGVKSGSTGCSLAEFRIGDSTSDYSSVHPLGWAQP